MFYFNCQLIKKMIKVVVIGRPTPSCFYWYTVHTTYRLIVVKFKTNSTPPFDSQSQKNILKNKSQKQMFGSMYQFLFMFFNAV